MGGVPLYPISQSAGAYKIPKAGSDGKIASGYIPDLSAVYQPLDADLTALAALSSTGFAKRTGSDTWTVGSLVAGDIPSLAASIITSGQLALARGGTNADLSATGGSNQFVKQSSAGAALTVGAILSADLTSALTTPPAIGGTTPAAITGTTVTATGNATASRFVATATLNTGIHFGHADAPNTGLRIINSARFGIYSGDKLTFYSADGNDVRVYINDVIVLRADPNSNMSIGSTTTTAPPTKLWLLTSDAVTNAVTNGLTISHYSSGTPVAGFGSGLIFTLESSTTEGQSAGLIESLWNDATHASRKADLVLSAYDTAKREGLRIRGAGSAAALGFFGATPAARPTGYTAFANLSTDRTLDANATTLDEVADVLGTLIQDLKTLGIIAA